MSVRQQVVGGVLAVLLITMIGATAARTSASIGGRAKPSVWLDPHVPDELLASRLNLTNIAKTPREP